MKVIFFWTFIAKSSWNISKDNIIITVVNIRFYYHLTRERAAHFLLLYPRFLFLLSVWQFAQETHLFQFTWFFIRSVPLFLPAWDPLLLLKHSLSTFFEHILYPTSPTTYNVPFLSSHTSHPVLHAVPEWGRKTRGYLWTFAFWFCKSFNISLVYQSYGVNCTILEVILKIQRERKCCGLLLVQSFLPIEFIWRRLYLSISMCLLFG